MAVMTPITLTNLVNYTVIPTGLGFLFLYAFSLKKELCAASGNPRSLSSGKTLEMLVLEAEAEARECTKAGSVSLQKPVSAKERTFATLDEAYQQALHDVFYFPGYKAPHGGCACGRGLATNSRSTSPPWQLPSKPPIRRGTRSSPLTPKLKWSCLPNKPAQPMKWPKRQATGKPSRTRMEPSTPTTVI